MSDGGKCYGGEYSRQGGAVLEWGVICNFKCGGEAALIREVMCDARPTGGEEAHPEDTWVGIPGRRAFQPEGTSGAKALRPQHACQDVGAAGRPPNGQPPPPPTEHGLATPKQLENLM